ncbi:hypothetical protein A9Q87_01030 [Flavobacteriales bacterium 34_180_T64]|nr:hypothetical protein A9Q87_01030 [Flavobacteriales bacterium 34_180_T64]
MKNTLIIIATLIISFNAIGQKKEMHNCLSKISLEPSFIAFTTHKDSELGNWYKNTFGLEIVKEFTFPDGSATGVLMKKDEFVVEIFYRNDALKKSDIKPDSNSEQWSGFMKFGFYTDANLKDLKVCLKSKHINAGRIFRDDNLGIDLLQVIDPEGNVLEIISRLKK